MQTSCKMKFVLLKNIRNTQETVQATVTTGHDRLSVFPFIYFFHFIFSASPVTRKNEREHPYTRIHEIIKAQRRGDWANSDMIQTT